MGGGPRRGVNPEGGNGADAVTFEQGIAEGRLKDKWTAMMKGLAQEWPTPTDALAALLEGQVSEEEGRALYERFGFTEFGRRRGYYPNAPEGGREDALIFCRRLN